MEDLFPAVAVKQGGVGGGLEGEEHPDRKQHKGREPHTKEHVEVTEDGHALGNGRDEVVDDEKHHGNHHGKPQSALADDAAQRCADEEEDDARDAQGEFLVPFLLVLVDVLGLVFEIGFVEGDIVLGVLC